MSGMRIPPLLWGLAGVGAGILAYGALVERRHLVREHYRIPLRRWPARLDGYRIAVFGDLHIRGSGSARLAREAVEMALAAEPDMIAIVGDFVEAWQPKFVPLLGHALEPLSLMRGRVVAVPGNHEYIGGDPSLLSPFCEELGIRLLRNQAWKHAGIWWVGIDSANEGMADPAEALVQTDGDEPIVVLWHEPDLVEALPRIASLMLSGHSHGGQFLFPGGFAPMSTRNGRRYKRGFYPHAPVPLFVTRGVGTTGPPSRWLCRPEVAILTIVSLE